MPDRISASECHAVLEALGYHQMTNHPEEVVYISSGIVSGPKGLFHVVPEGAELDLALFREWLCDHVGIAEAEADRALREVLEPRG